MEGKETLLYSWYCTVHKDTDMQHCSSYKMDGMHLQSSHLPHPPTSESSDSSVATSVASNCTPEKINKCTVS